MGFKLTHHPDKGTISIEMSETAVLLLYVSGFAVLISAFPRLDAAQEQPGGGMTSADMAKLQAFLQHTIQQTVSKEVGGVRR